MFLQSKLYFNSSRFASHFLLPLYAKPLKTAFITAFTIEHRQDFIAYLLIFQ